jgi:hypothetical protein
LARLFGQGNCLTPEQKQSLGLDIDFTCQLTNTCGRDLLPEHELYDPYAGRSISTWGKFNLAWDESDFNWKNASYNEEFGYRQGDRVVYPAEDGYLLILYEAAEDIPPPVGVFDESKWTEICRVQVSELDYLPSYAELAVKYPYYDSSLYLESWSEFSANWSENLASLDNDIWSEAKIKKEFLYREGDVVLYDSRCKDHTCVFIAAQDVPAVEEVLIPAPPYWQRLFCVKNGNAYDCGKIKKCGYGRKLVSLSSGDNDLVCVPNASAVTGASPLFLAGMV